MRMKAGMQEAFTMCHSAGGFSVVLFRILHEYFILHNHKKTLIPGDMVTYDWIANKKRMYQLIGRRQSHLNPDRHMCCWNTTKVKYIHLR